MQTTTNHRKLTGVPPATASVLTSPPSGPCAASAGHTAGAGQVGGSMRITTTDKFWIVMKASDPRELADVLFETHLHGLANQFRGGLLPSEILLLTDDRDAAHDLAVSELQRAKEAAHAR